MFQQVDTRKKIVNLKDLPELLADGNWTVVAGFFDPLTLVQAERLAEAAKGGRSVLAIVYSSSEGLLPVEARSALIAGLRDVRAVVIADRAGWKAAVAALDDLHVDEDDEADVARSTAFERFIIDRQRSAEVLQ